MPYCQNSSIDIMSPFNQIELFEGVNVSTTKISIQTQNEGFIDISTQVKDLLQSTFKLEALSSGLLVIYCPHTSCALAINEAYDPSAANDMEQFLQHLAPPNLSFIKHTTEGPDDSPSHMKSILLQTSLCLIIEKGELLLGPWQGIYLCEFRQGTRTRNLYIKWMPNQE